LGTSATRPARGRRWIGQTTRCVVLSKSEGHTEWGKARHLKGGTWKRCSVMLGEKRLWGRVKGNQRVEGMAERVLGRLGGLVTVLGATKKTGKTVKKVTEGKGAAG